MIRIENKENSPSLKLFFSIVDALGYEIKIEKKQQRQCNKGAVAK